MTMHPLDIIRRDMNVALTLTRKPEQREPRRDLSPKTIAWLERRMPSFRELRAITQRVQAEYQASKKALKA